MPLLRSPLLGNHDGGFECVNEYDTVHGFARSGEKFAEKCVVSGLKSATTASVEADLASTFKNGHRYFNSKHRRFSGRHLDGVDLKSVPSGTTLQCDDAEGTEDFSRTGVYKSYIDICDLLRDQVKEQITDRLGEAQQRAPKKTMCDNFLSDCGAYETLEVRLFASS